MGFAIFAYDESATERRRIQRRGNVRSSSRNCLNNRHKQVIPQSRRDSSNRSNYGTLLKNMQPPARRVEQHWVSNLESQQTQQHACIQIERVLRCMRDNIATLSSSRWVTLANSLYRLCRNVMWRSVIGHVHVRMANFRLPKMIVKHDIMWWRLGGNGRGSAWSLMPWISHLVLQKVQILHVATPSIDCTP